MMLSFYALAFPTITLSFKNAQSPEQFSTILQILILLTVLSVAPALLLMLTSFTRLIVVFSILRHAIGTQQTPPNQVLISLALFLTIFIMAPTFQAVYEEALVPYFNKEINEKEMFERAAKPFKEFMFKNTREKDLALFIKLRKEERPKTPEDVSIFTLIPAFMISEIKTAFEIVFIIYLPFIVIDFVVASILMSMGMMMVPPMFISLPFKLMLFVLADGWELLTKALIQSYKF